MVVGLVTDRDIETIKAYVETGSMRGAAQRLGIRESSVKNTLHRIHQRTGAKNTAQAVYWLTKEGALF